MPPCEIEPAIAFTHVEPPTEEGPAIGGGQAPEPADLEELAARLD